MNKATSEIRVTRANVYHGRNNVFSNRECNIDFKRERNRIYKRKKLDSTGGSNFSLLENEDGESIREGQSILFSVVAISLQGERNIGLFHTMIVEE